MNGKQSHAVERDRIQFHILSALAQNPHSRGLVLKGGTMLRMCVFPDYRFSEDLDFEWGSDTDELAPMFEAAVRVASVSTSADVAFTDRGKGRRSADFVSSGQSGRIKIDISSRTEHEPTSWAFQENDTWDNRDKNLSIVGHSLPVVAKEKFACLGNRAKGRDYYDLMKLDTFSGVCAGGWELYVSACGSGMAGQWVQPSELLAVMYEQLEAVSEEWEKSQADFLLPPDEEFDDVFGYVAKMVEKNY